MSKIPEYTKRAYRNWYVRNKDNEEFKQKRAETNRRAYEKRKLRQTQQSNIVVNKLDENNSNIVVNIDESNIVVNKLDETNSNILVSLEESNSNIVVNKLDETNSNIVVNLEESNSNIVVNLEESNSNIVVKLDEINSNIVVNLEEKEKRRLRQLEKDFNNLFYNLVNDDEIEKTEWDLLKGVFVNENWDSFYECRYKPKFNRVIEKIKTMRNNKNNNTNLRQTKKNFK
jgi:hypothetical protein